MQGFNIIASGSSDCGVILWDLRTRAFLRELAGHMYPVDKVAINSANGNVMTATTQELRVWSINGDLLAACTVQGFGLSTIVSVRHVFDVMHCVLLLTELFPDMRDLDEMRELAERCRRGNWPLERNDRTVGDLVSVRHGEGSACSGRDGAG